MVGSVWFHLQLLFPSHLSVPEQFLSDELNRFVRSNIKELPDAIQNQHYLDVSEMLFPLQAAALSKHFHLLPNNHQEKDCFTRGDSFNAGKHFSQAIINIFRDLLH